MVSGKVEEGKPKRKEMRNKLWSCKEGTIPELIVLRYNYKIREGLRIIYRHENEGQNNWRTGIIWRVNPDGYFFIDRM